MREDEFGWSSVGIRKDLKERLRKLGKKDENWNDLIERLIFGDAMKNEIPGQ